MTEMEKALVAELDSELASEGHLAQSALKQAMAAVDDATAQTLAFRSKRPQTLAEQIQQLTRIERQLTDRLRHEGVEARITAERKISEAMAHHARTLAEETARIDRDRDEMIRQATDEYHNTLHDLAGLARRRP
jgi:hypothetical protein